MSKQQRNCRPQAMKQSLARILDNNKRLGIAAICIVLLAITVTACSQPQNNEPSGSNPPNDAQKPVKACDLPRIEGLLGALADSHIAGDGRIDITVDIKRQFNQMGTDYRFFFMPVVNWYDFESTGTALAYLFFTWTGDFGTFPESIPKNEAEARLRKIFAAPNNVYPQLEHQPYRKSVMFDGEAYTPWPESYNDSTMIYNLVDLRVRQDGDYTYYAASADEYQFDLAGHYEPGENEKFLFARAETLGLDYPATLAKLLETGEISAAHKSRTYAIEFRIEGSNTVPMFVSVDKLENG